MNKLFLLVLGLSIILGLNAPQAHAAISSEMIAKAVTVFFSDTPTMVAIAQCESEMRQYDESGRVLRGGAGGQMIGLFQLYETYHRDAASARGYNIDSLVGNMAYARDLYRSEGTTPWNSSASCWTTAVPTVIASVPVVQQDTLLLASAVSEAVQNQYAPPLLTKELSYGTTAEEVRLLQRVLNGAGYTVTQSGNETTYFGVGTYKALARFQCAHNLACITKPETARNIGRLDADTRIVINRLVVTVS